MTQTTKLKLLRDGIDSFGEPVKAERWVNVHFDNNGRSYRSYMTFLTKESAADAVKICIHQCEYDGHKSFPALGGPVKNIATFDGKPINAIWYADYSHTIQLPVRS